mgnify:CR=1 FL=1
MSFPRGWSGPGRQRGAIGLIAAVSLGLGLLFCLAWLLLVRHSARVKVERGSKAPPRYSWPSLNPRAPPLSA